MLDASGTHSSRRQLPQLLEAERIGLWTVTLGEIELFDQLFGDRSAATFGQQCQPGVNVRTGRIVGPWGTVAIQAHIADAHPFDRPALIEQSLGRREARENVGAQALCLLREPRGELTERDDVVAVVVERRAVGHRARQQLHQQLGDGLERSLGREDSKGILSTAGTFMPWYSPPHSGNNCSSGPGSITAPEIEWAPTTEPFSSTHTLALRQQLPQPDRGSEARGPGADDQIVILH